MSNPTLASTYQNNFPDAAIYVIFLFIFMNGNNSINRSVVESVGECNSRNSVTTAAYDCQSSLTIDACNRENIYVLLYHCHS